jgi:hypothetical protein
MAKSWNKLFLQHLGIPTHSKKKFWRSVHFFWRIDRRWRKIFFLIFTHWRIDHWRNDHWRSVHSDEMTAYWRTVHWRKDHWRSVLWRKDRQRINLVWFYSWIGDDFLRHRLTYFIKFDTTNKRLFSTILFSSVAQNQFSSVALLISGSNLRISPNIHNICIIIRTLKLLI